MTFAFEGKNGKKSLFYPFYLVTTKWLQKWVLEVSEVVHELHTRRFQVHELTFGSYEPISMSNQTFSSLILRDSKRDFWRNKTLEASRICRKAILAVWMRNRFIFRYQTRNLYNDVYNNVRNQSRCDDCCICLRSDLVSSLFLVFFRSKYNIYLNENTDLMTFTELCSAVLCNKVSKMKAKDEKRPYHVIHIPIMVPTVSVV